MRRLPILALGVLLLTTGCIGLTGDDATDPTTSAFTGGTDELSPVTKVDKRHELDFTIDEGPSNVLEPGAFEILDGVGVHVNVELPATEGSAAAAGMTQVHMGLFLPEIPGCDWGLEDGATVASPEEALGNADLPERCQLPVVADIGPYYSSTAEESPVLAGQAGFAMEGDSVATEPAQRLGGFLMEQLVPHGYAVAQVSVFGTGDSGHCMDLMGDSEQAGIDAAVEFLGEASFSNGNVGLTGRSYDGTTPWEAASTPAANDHLKTIAPISGLLGLKDLMWRNGSAEARGGTGLLWGLYYSFGADGAPSDAHHALCPDATLQGLPQHLAAYATGGDLGPAEVAYWEERSNFLEKALENYNGSVYLIHGFQDWNVDPHMAFPAFEKLHAAGIETKALIGQWAHMYPDRIEEHENLPSGYGEEAFPATVRHDWAQDLLEWFDHYLKGTGAKPQLHAEIQDNRGYWRIEQHYPPTDADPIELTLDEAELSGASPAGTYVGGLPDAGLVSTSVGEQNLTVTFDPLSEDTATRIVGMPTFHVQVTPTGPGGQLFAELRDADTGLRLGHAIMDLRYHAGGDTMQPVTPGQPITAKMQFLAMDAVLPAGHGLELNLAPTGMDYMTPSVNTPVEIHATDDSVLTLDTVERTAEAFFLPPGLAEVLGDGVPPDADETPETGWEIGAGDTSDEAATAR